MFGSVFADNGNYLAQDGAALTVDGLVLGAGVFGIEPDMAVFTAVGLDGGLVLEEGDHDVVVADGYLLMDDDIVTGQNACLQHGLAADTEGKMLTGETLGVEGQVVLNALFRQDGGACGNGAEQGYLILAVVRAVGDGDGTGLALGLGDQAGLTQSLQVEVDGGGGFQIYGFGDLTDGGG